MSSFDESSTAAINASKVGGAKTSTMNLTDATRRRATAAATIRDKKKLELMTQRRKECDSDEENNDNNNNQSNNNNNNNNNNNTQGRSGYHKSYEQIDRQDAFENLQNYIAMCNPGNNSPDDVRRASFTIRALLMQDEPNPIPKLRDFGGIEALVALLGCPDSTVQYDTLWSLSNIVTCSDDDCDHVMRADAVPAIISLLLHRDDEKIRRQAAWCLGNICGLGEKQRRYLLDNGAMKALIVAIVGDENHQPFDYKANNSMRNLTWLMAQLCRFKPAPPFDQVAICMPVLKRLLEHPDPSVRIDACWAASFLSDGALERLRAVYDAGLIQPIIGQFQSREEKFVLPCLRTFGNYTSKDDTTHLIFEWKIIDNLQNCLSIDAPRQIRKEALWIISNAVCGTPEQVKHILDAGLIPLVVNCIGHHEYEVKKEAAWTIANLAQYAPIDVIRYLVESCGTLDALCHLMSQQEERSCTLAVEALLPILIAGNQLRDSNNGRNPYADRVEDLGGAQSIEDLVNHVSSTLSLGALQLLDGFFPARSEKIRTEDGGDGYCDYGDDDNNDNNDGPNPHHPNGNNGNYGDGFDSNSRGGGYNI